jgi:hypothetical protein
MIKFFRKIRQNLLSEGKTGKYLKYAIGEIILVVIGILIALQINNWNENRKTNIQELQLLESLQKEFTYNKNELDRSIEKAQIIQRRCETILKNTGNREIKLSKLESDSLINFGLTNIITYDPSNGIISDIISSGKIQIIQNEKLRNLLSNWNGMLNDVKEDETWAVNSRNNIIYPFLHKNLNSTSTSQNNEISTGFDSDYRTIYKLMEFENLVNSHRIWNRKNEWNYKGLKNKIEEIITICEEEIDFKK